MTDRRRLVESVDGTQLGALLKTLGVDLAELSLLELALTHSSHAPSGKNFERLEFLGDSVLSMVVSRYLYLEFPTATEGYLTRTRAAVVREESLAEAAKRLELGKLLILDKNQETAGGRNRNSILADCFESVLASIYLTRGWKVAQDFTLEALAPELKAAIEGCLLVTDPKSQLQEYLQSKKKSTPLYNIVGAEGPDHNKTFEAQVEHEGRVLGRGTGTSKQRAEQAAAEDALKGLEL